MLKVFLIAIFSLTTTPVFSTLNAKFNKDRTVVFDYIVAYRFCGKFTELIYSIDKVPYYITIGIYNDDTQSAALRLITRFSLEKRKIIETTQNLEKIAAITCEN